MKTNFNDIDDLLVKQLTGEATEADHEQVRQWLLASEGNRKYYDHFRVIWEESARLASATPVDENAAWERFQQKVQYEKTVAARKRALLFINHPIMKVAAIIVLVAGLTRLGFFLFSEKPAKPLSIQTASYVKKDTLPDGSQVTLNKHSSLFYPDRFTGKERRVVLNGEAFFKITPDKSKPFIIHTENDITILVVGTSFNVKTRGDSTEVIVETGIVEVTKGSATVTLHAGERTVIPLKKEVLQKQSNKDHLYTYYRNKKFICENTPLWKLVDILNEAYDAQIVIEGETLRNEPITTTFDNEPLDSVLNILQQTQGFTVIKENGRIILR